MAEDFAVVQNYCSDFWRVGWCELILSGHLFVLSRC
jgi:hypothetical protein